MKNTPDARGLASKARVGEVTMIDCTTRANKDLGQIGPIASIKGQILKVRMASGATFCARLIDIQDQTLVFESKKGIKTLCRLDQISHAVEVAPRGRP